MAHAPRLWGFALFGVVLCAVVARAPRQIHTHEVRARLRALDPRVGRGCAARMTVANIAVMGFYDVIAFRHTPHAARERWRYGAVAFCLEQLPHAGSARRTGDPLLALPADV